MKVTVVSVFAGAGETISYGRGFSALGESVLFVGDWRPMSELKIAVDSAREEGIPGPEVYLEPWQILDDGRPGTEDMA